MHLKLNFINNNILMIEYTFTFTKNNLLTENCSVYTVMLLKLYTFTFTNNNLLTEFFSVFCLYSDAIKIIYIITVFY